MVSAVLRWCRPMPLMVQIALKVSVQHKYPDLSNCRKERKVLQVLTFRTFPVHELGTNSVAHASLKEQAAIHHSAYG